MPKYPFFMGLTKPYSEKSYYSNCLYCIALSDNKIINVYESGDFKEIEINSESIQRDIKIKRSRVIPKKEIIKKFGPLPPKLKERLDEITLPRIVKQKELRAGDIFIWKLKGEKDEEFSPEILMLDPKQNNKNQCLNLETKENEYIFDWRNKREHGVIFKLISRNNPIDKTPEINNTVNNMKTPPPDMTERYQYYIFEPNPVVHKTICNYLKDLGFNDCNLDTGYKQIVISFKENSISGNCEEEKKPYCGQKIDLNFLFSQEFRDLYEKSKIKKQIVKLNNDYSAEVVRGQDFVTVGCQKIPIINIRELVAVIDDVNS